MLTMKDIAFKVFCIGWLATVDKKSKVSLDMIDLAHDMIWNGEY